MSAWPPVDAERLADAIDSLAGRIGERELRAQVYALAGVVRHLGAEGTAQDRRAGLEEKLERALQLEHESRVVELVRELARLDRSAVRPIDWDAASGG